MYLISIAPFGSKFIYIYMYRYLEVCGSLSYIFKISLNSGERRQANHRHKRPFKREMGNRKPKRSVVSCASGKTLQMSYSSQATPLQGKRLSTVFQWRSV